MITYLCRSCQFCRQYFNRLNLRVKYSGRPPAVRTLGIGVYIYILFFFSLSFLRFLWPKKNKREMCGWSSVRGRYYASSGEYWGVMSRENGGNPRGQKVKVFSLIVIWLSFLLVHLLWFLRSKRADFKHSYIAILSLKCLKHMIIRRLGPYLWRLSKSWLQTKTSHTYPPP